MDIVCVATVVPSYFAALSSLGCVLCLSPLSCVLPTGSDCESETSRFVYFSHIRSAFESRNIQNVPVDHLRFLEYFDPLFSRTHGRSETSELA